MATGSVYCLVVFAILGGVAFLTGLAAILHRIGHRKGSAFVGSATVTALTPREAKETDEIHPQDPPSSYSGPQSG